MTNRIPLIVNPGAAQIQEVAAADTLQVPGTLTANVVQSNNYQYANGQPFASSNYGDANVEALLNDGTFTGNIVPAGNATQSLGNATNQWLDLWVSNATIYLNSIPLGVSNTGVLQFDGNDIVTSGPNVINTGNVETTGDVVGGNLVITTGGGLTFADGSVQTTAYGNANVEAYLSSSNTIAAINANVANTNANVANLTTALGNTNANVANLVTVTTNTDSNVANLVTITTNTDSNVANLVTITTNTDSNVANLNTALANTNSNVANLTATVSDQANAIGNLQGSTYSNANAAGFLAAFGSNTITTTGAISVGNVTLTDLYSPNYFANAVMFANAAGHVTNASLFKYDPGTEVLTVGAVSTTGNVVVGTTLTAGNLAGEGGNISNITGANVVGAVALATNANIADLAYSVDGANVVGEVAVANTVSNPSQSNITALGTITALTANAVTINGQLTANGNAQFNQDVYFAGNVTLPGNIIQISGNSGTFFGNAITGFGALYAGLPAGYTLLAQEVMQFATSFDGYTQVSMQNINAGAQATGDFIVTADNGGDTTNYVDLGMAGSGYNGALANNSLGTSLFPNDGYLYAKGNVSGGNLVLGSKQAGGVVRIIANGASNIGDVVATFRANGLAVNGNVAINGGNLAWANASIVQTSAVDFSITGDGQVTVRSLDGTYQWTFDDAGNLTAPGNIGTLANVSANYFLGNGSQLTGLDSSPAISSINANIANTNSNVANLTSALGNTDSNVANLVTVTTNTNSNVANLTSALANTNNSVANNTSNITTLQGQVYANANAQAYLASNANVAITTTGNITTTANITAGFFIGNGSQLTNITGANVIGNVTSAITAGTVTTNAQSNITSVGTLDSLAVTGNTDLGSINASGTIVLNSVTITETMLTTTGSSFEILGTDQGVQLHSLDTANNTFSLVFADNTGVGLVTDAGELVVGIDGNVTVTDSMSVGGELSTTGNITSSYDVTANSFIGDGSQLTGLPAGYTDANVVTLLADFGSNTISTTGNVSTGNIVTGGGTGGNITGVNIMSANIFVGDGGNLTNLPSSGLVVNSMTSGANITAAVTDTQYNVTALSESATVTIPTGVAQDGQKLTYRIRDSGVAQTLAWDPIYVVIGTTLPVTTVANKYTYVGCIYNEQELSWDVVSVAQQA